MSPQEKAEAKRARKRARGAGFAKPTESCDREAWRSMKVTRWTELQEKNEERVAKAERRKQLSKDQAAGQRVARLAKEVARLTAIQARRERRRAARRGS